MISEFTHALLGDEGSWMVGFHFVKRVGQLRISICWKGWKRSISQWGGCWADM